MGVVFGPAPSFPAFYPTLRPDEEQIKADTRKVLPICALLRDVQAGLAVGGGEVNLHNH